VNVFSIALSFFLIANPFGNSPAVLAVVKDFPFARQKAILLRESLIALVLALFFQFCGRTFLDALGIADYAVPLCGGALLFIVALGMIFPIDSTQSTQQKTHQEPIVVPIATPLISGPGLLASIMLYSQKVQDPYMVTTAILITWVGVTLVLVNAPYMQKVLGRQGMVALEQLMGMAVSMIAMDMLVTGTALFLNTFPH
jgi:multiple antibiotic resistance protein